MTCARTFEVEAVRDGRLTGRAAASVVQHASGCADCRAHTGTVDALARALRDHPVAPDDELAARRDRQRLLAVEGGELLTAPRSRWRRGAAVAAAATAVALVAVALVAYTRGSSSEPPQQPDPVRVVADHARWSRVDDGATTQLRIDDGLVDVHVDHAGPWHHLVVLVPDGRIDDLGTTFHVRVEDGHVSEVRVSEGAIVLRRASHPSVTLVAGDAWNAADERAAIAPAPATVAIAPAPPAPLRAPSRTDAPVPPRAHTQDDVVAIELRDAVAALDAGRYDEAATALRVFLARHPDDPRAEDAAYVLVITLERAHDLAGAQAAARDYLRRFPNGFRRQSVESIAR
jgi:hypothetical protein